MIYVGARFGRLKVERIARRVPKHGLVWLCRCDCGATKEVIGGNLLHGLTNSCGCLRRESSTERFTTHGQGGVRHRTKEYRIWMGMKQRCFNENHISYPWYGGKGVTVCKRWVVSFEHFFADMGKCPKGKTLDRINSKGNYEPSNCRWATRKQQAANKG